MRKAYFDPETIVMLRDILERSWHSLPPERQRCVARSDLAVRILQCAAGGERDPDALREAALQPHELAV